MPSPAARPPSRPPWSARAATWLRSSADTQPDGAVKWSTGLQPLADIANVEHFVPRDWISEDGFLPNEKFVDYARPLIEGEVKPPVEGGLPSTSCWKRPKWRRNSRRANPKKGGGPGERGGVGAAFGEGAGFQEGLSRSWTPGRPDIRLARSICI